MEGGHPSKKCLAVAAAQPADVDEALMPFLLPLLFLGRLSLEGMTKNARALFQNLETLNPRGVTGAGR
eukprot:1934360-Prorocentrum_lima.AAC.1